MGKTRKDSHNFATEKNGNSKSYKSRKKNLRKDDYDEEILDLLYSDNNDSSFFQDDLLEPDYDLFK